MARFDGRRGDAAAVFRGSKHVTTGWEKRAFARRVTALLLALAVWTTSALAWNLPDGDGPRFVRVAWVYDGDTCRLESGERLRLAGIDAPELGHDGAPGQYYAQESKTALLRLVRGVSLRFVGVGPGRDRFDRLLGELLLPDGTSVGERLVAEGAAFFFRFDDLSPALGERLLAAQRRAMAAGKGFWPRLLALPAPAAPYRGNAASGRFHAPDCPEGARIARRNLLLLPTLSEAFARGLAPARECTPWPVSR